MRPGVWGLIVTPGKEYSVGRCQAKSTHLGDARGADPSHTYVADGLAGWLDSTAEEEEGVEAEGAAAATVSAATETTWGSNLDEDAAVAAAEALHQVSGREAGRGPGSVATASAAWRRWRQPVKEWVLDLVTEEEKEEDEHQAPSDIFWAIPPLLYTFLTPRHYNVSLGLQAPAYSGRLHLALFYKYGAYYSLAHCLAGVHYSLSMRPLQGWVLQSLRGNKPK
ncbi:hypothetical protein VOLCADRAFT_97277 [Volvox carteri f. nagariensis]|uniref:Uncharacterized protein n=1 Tax=Volvox carteri f. nagariensis TaxID=3068 RepID=D8UCC5_VOLCA|nr:uncharacterized protein VOLCADRAFT_97277 [Volvox carteri f. nagariensis]EFJ42621.1 hypothetical protein VOLCADRAFT_97277 [Volvox carteri f. nagariensis]|eukprot:XP_002956272.1 hypothetical protein VOLCADRAFT_97277 [Volvox carteri f. nagariensis]